MHFRICDNPDCDCRIVDILFVELDDAGRPLRKGAKFSAGIRVQEWEEGESPPRSPEEAACVREFLDECPPERRAAIMQHYRDFKQEARRFAEYAINRRDILEGRLISYVDIVSEGGALSSGGRDCSYQLVHEGREFLIEDRYCGNPQCDCDEVVLEFFEVITTQQAEGEPRVTIEQRLRSELSLDGNHQVSERFGCTMSEARAILSAWWDEYQDDLEMLSGRYRRIKKMCQRILDKNGKQTPGRVTSSRDSVTSGQAEPVDADSSPARVGRNDPCPCGSGRKYKKCCGSRA
jgi:hypothetical protein